MKLQRAETMPKCLWARLLLLALAGVSIGLGLSFAEPAPYGLAATSLPITKENESAAQINIEASCLGQSTPSYSLSGVMTLLQPVRFSHPAAMIRIGLPVRDSSVANQTLVQIGERNAYSPEIIEGTLSPEWPLTFDTCTGMAYTPYFSYSLSTTKSYLIRIRSTQADGLAQCDVLLGGYYEPARTSITGIEVYSGPQRIDPYGSIQAGTELRVVVRVEAPNVHWSTLTARLSYRVNRSQASVSEWIPAESDFTPFPGTLEGRWVVPLQAADGNYDLKIEVTDSNGQKKVWQELNEFEVSPRDASSSYREETLERDVTPTSPSLLMRMQIPSLPLLTAFEESILLPRGDEIWLLGYPLTISPEDLASQWTVTMSVRLQGGTWITLPPPKWFPETTPDSWLARWVIPNDSELGPYDVRFEATNRDGNWTGDYVITEGFTVVDDQIIYQEWGNGIAYIDLTHRSALPMVIQANPSPVDYSLDYVDRGHIEVVPKSNVSQSKWSIVNFVETADFPVSSFDHAIALADINGDGMQEIIRAWMNKIEVVTISGMLLWNYALPALADQLLVEDIDCDGKLEILVTTVMVNGSGYGRVIALDQAGNLKWQNEVWSNAHAIAVWYPTAGGVGQVIVGTCANLVYVFSHEGVLLNWKTIVPGEWSSIDSVAVGDVDGDGQDEFILGVWRMDRGDLWVLTPKLETKWSLTLDSLGSFLGATPVLDGIALIPAPSGGQFIWVATTPLDYNVVVDPILLQIDGRSAQVVAEYHLNRYVPVEGAGDIRDFIRLRTAVWNDSYVSSEILVEVSGQLLVFDSEGLKGIIKLSEAAIVSFSNASRLPNGDIVMVVSYLSDSTGELGVKILRELKLSSVITSAYPYNAQTMQGRLVATISDLFGLKYTHVVALLPYEPKPILVNIEPDSVEVGSGSLIHGTSVWPSIIGPAPRTYEPATPTWPALASEPHLEEKQQQEREAWQRAEEEAQQPLVEEERQPAFADDRDETVPTLMEVKPVPLGMEGERSDRGTEDLGPEYDVRDVSAAWKQLHCGVWLSLKAAANALRGDFDVALYLNEQATQAITGGPLGVHCPDPLPQPEGSVQKDTGPPAPQTQLYKILLNSTIEETGRLINAQQSILELTETKKKADREVAEKRLKLELIKLKLVDPKSPEEVKQKKEDSEAEKLLREAEEVSKKAEEDRQEVVKDLAEAKLEKQRAEEGIGRNRAVFEEVETNPEGAPEYPVQFKKQQE